jgi:hypothetical protein
MQNSFVERIPQSYSVDRGTTVLPSVFEKTPVFAAFSIGDPNQPCP